MEYIIGHCVTDVKGCEKEIWPSVFHPNISVGHFVQSENGKKLVVASITHILREKELNSGKHQDVPFAIIELCDYRS